MKNNIPAPRRKLIERIVGSIASARSLGSKRENAEFLRAYYHGVEESDLEVYDAEQLACAAMAHRALSRIRKSGAPVVRVYNPVSERDGWSSTHTAVQVTTDDMPFLVDSLRMVIDRRGLAIHFMAHPILTVRRDGRGRLLSISHGDREKSLQESWQFFELDHVGDAAELKRIENDIRAVLEDVRLACEDWKLMRERALSIAREIEADPPAIAPSEASEGAALLRWMEDNHFTFLGFREYRLQRGRAADELIALPNTGLGILRKQHATDAGATPTKLTGDMQHLAREPELILVTKANAIATVHRATYLDYVGVKIFDSSGNVTGERRFLGLFTSTVYSRSPRDIPLLRHKIKRVIDHFDLSPTSHDGKAVLHVLESYPRDELFHASVADLIRIVRGIVNLYERHRVRLFLRRDPIGRFYSCLIYVPRDRYNTHVRERIETILRRELHGTAIEFQVQLSDSALARLHLVVRTEARHERPDVDHLETLVTDAVRTWDDKMREVAVARHGESAGLALARRYEHAFPAAYEEDVSAADALADIEQIERVHNDPDTLAIRLKDGDQQLLHLRLFRSAAPITLSDALPVLENLGFTVLSERPYRIVTQQQRPIWMQDFEMQPREDSKRGAALPVEPKRSKRTDSAARDTRLINAFEQVWRGNAENDGFNRLIWLAGLEWRQTMILRAYCKFILQTGAAFSQSYMEQVLAGNPTVAKLLWQLFAAQFDPALASARRAREISVVNDSLARALDAVTSLDEDRILRRFVNAIESTLRTNFYQTDADGRLKGYVSFKFDSRKMPDLPQPRPHAEIFVYSPRVEGVHLRMGMVARGGLRWSDRREDFRTEVLGLMKAQNVKNTLIVPVGAKGGFVVKRPPQNATREDLQREGVACYRTFICGLLDLTDNLMKGKVVPPANVVRRDGDDPYLVVAADKGTATFSDIANRVAADYHFWLGDAFASGGSAGYDHKKIGITARGAWESVKRHFRELGVDTQSQPFTVAGIGDMSGDVFGNGMLQSEHIRLVAAFDHRHIFIDPNPDAVRSFAERQRMFALPRSSWEDYDTKLISKGGGVFPRTSKSIRLSPEARQLLQLDSAELSPLEVIRAILRMSVDLLFNGGIGTYVKATDESHAEVGDRTNDAVRVNGKELRCRVVGEGGNLGLSQRGRIEYALHGGRINTDFVDNSGGVDCSDHEVNIKILLNIVTEQTGLKRPDRDRLLAAMTDEVAALVLRDNYLQSQALSVLSVRAVEELEEHAHLIRSLELSGHLDRGLEFLPDAEAIAERGEAKRGLTRPELAVLLAYGKMALYSRLIDSDVPEDPYLSNELDRYFPDQLSRRYARLLAKHRLRREIIATATTNSLVNRMGPAFARRAQEDTGADAATVARAYTIARESLDARTLWQAIEGLDNKIAASVQYDMMRQTTDLLQFFTYWLIRRHSGALNIDDQVSRLRPPLGQLMQAMPAVLSGTDRDRHAATLDRLSEGHVPEKLRTNMAAVSVMYAGPDLVELAAQTKLPVTDVARAYFELGSALSLDWLRQEIERLQIEGHWQGVARESLRDDIFSLQRAICFQALNTRTTRGQSSTSAWLDAHAAQVAYAQQTVGEMRKLAARDFATLSVALQSVRRLTDA